MADFKIRTDRDALNKALIAAWKRQSQVKMSIEATTIKKQWTKSDALKRAQRQITAWEWQHSLVKSISEIERVATKEKIAKLRALRLAKEEAGRAEQSANHSLPVRARREPKLMNTERSHR